MRDAVERIRHVLPEDASRFASDRDAREIVALNLLVALQEVIDLAAHALADAGHAVPGTYRDVFRSMAGQGSLDPTLADRLAAACGLRNRLAHQYGTIDWLRVHEAAVGGLEDLERFCAHVAAAVGRGEDPPSHSEA